MTADDLIAEFQLTLGIRFSPSSALYQRLSSSLDRLRDQSLRNAEDRRRLLLGSVNEKFDLNHAAAQEFLTTAARGGVTFNYHGKKDIRHAFDYHDAQCLRTLLRATKGLSDELQAALTSRFNPVPFDYTIARLRAELLSPTLTRKDSKPKDWSAEILTSLFGAFVFLSFGDKAMHMLADPQICDANYEADFWVHLHRNFPTLFSRQNALTAMRTLAGDLPSEGAYQRYSERVLRRLQLIYETSTNHSVVAILIEPLAIAKENVSWRLYGDLVLYGEKHLALLNTQAFFRHALVADATTKYIENLDREKAQFTRLNDGFRYLDCFVLGTGDEQRLLVLLQKHQADETVIPCPRCRSHDVQSNSYSTMGVRSFECNNQLCADRSKFNRGKRYSFLQLLKQRGIEDQRNTVPQRSVREWARDVQPERSDAEVLEMLVRHYSLVGDAVHLWDWKGNRSELLGRRLIEHELDTDAEPSIAANAVAPVSFWDSPYFHRYVVKRSLVRGSLDRFEAKRVGDVTAYLGDAFDVLQCIDAESVDGAVTSPPYYNAREYSQWDNIYAYLYDMYNINREVFRVLKNGAVYLFNIFDYFDNERNVSLSAMGEKRIILGAYTIDLFRRIGFRCIGNIVWDKGEIEGKRGFNGGNFSPYYQSPFNCWEHIFVFAKGALGVGQVTFPKLLRCQPVIKMIGGQNTHGHSAPFPVAIPALLTGVLPPNALVLDPFAGSMTTALAAIQDGKRALCIERDSAYFQLGVNMVLDRQRQHSLL